MKTNDTLKVYWGGLGLGALVLLRYVDYCWALFDKSLFFALAGVFLVGGAALLSGSVASASPLLWCRRNAMNTTNTIKPMNPTPPFHRLKTSKRLQVLALGLVWLLLMAGITLYKETTLAMGQTVVFDIFGRSQRFVSGDYVILRYPVHDLYSFDSKAAHDLDASLHRADLCRPGY
ncbi:MAG: hypothetical protein R2857_13085 [Vampirovibrionales bacterium]